MKTSSQTFDEPRGRFWAILGDMVVDIVEIGFGRIGDDECAAGDSCERLLRSRSIGIALSRGEASARSLGTL